MGKEKGERKGGKTKERRRGRGRKRGRRRRRNGIGKRKVERRQLKKCWAHGRTDTKVILYSVQCYALH